MASLLKRSGRYYIQFHDSNRTPKQKQRTLKCKRKRTAQQARRKLEEAYALGEYDPWVQDPLTFLSKREQDQTPCTVQEALSRFLEQKEERGRTENTIRSYRGNVRRLISLEKRLQEVTSAVVRRYVYASDVSRSTQRKRYRHVHAFLEWCKEEGLLDSNPAREVERPSKGETQIKTLYREDLEKICKVVDEDWFKRLIRFAFFTGLRRMEIARLRWKDVDSDRGVLNIRKTKARKPQTAILTDAAQKELPERREKEDYVWYAEKKDRSPETFANHLTRRFKHYREKADISRPLTFHSLRHGFCTALAEQGKSAMVIKEAARHADISTSQRYVKLAQTHLRQELDGIFVSH